MSLKYGKAPAQPDAILLKFGTYSHAANLPTVPSVFGRPWLIKTFGMLGNADYGDCVWAGAAHETMYLRADAGNAPPLFSTQDALADYAAVTGFTTADPSTDRGTNVQAALSYRQKVGILDATAQRHKIGIYTALRVGDLGELALATYLFGVVGVGVLVPRGMQDQFSMAEPWDVIAGDENTGEGHYIPCVGRNSHGNYLFVSWGRLQAATPAWVEKQMDEAVTFISMERLNAMGISPQGFSTAQLADDFEQVTS